MNIVSLIMNTFNGDVIGRIAGALGIGKESAREAVSAGVPAVLARLSDLADEPDGARKLDEAIDSLDDRTLNNLSNAVSSGGGKSLIDTGTGQLGSLLGKNAMGGLGSALSKFSGLGGGAATSLLGMLTPIVLGFLKGQKKKQNLSAEGLANLLKGQRDNIYAAMPSGMESALANVGPVRNEEYAAAPARRSSYEPTQARIPVRAAERTGFSALKWLVPLALILGLVGLGWWLFNRTPGTVTANPRPAIGVTDAISDTVSRVTGNVTDWFSDATTSLNNITDADSARAALPDLEAMADQLEGWQSTLRNLPTEQRNTIVSLITDKWETLSALLTSVMERPGVREVIQPVMDRITNAIDAIKA